MFDNSSYKDYSLSVFHSFEYSLNSMISTYKSYIDENEKFIRKLEADLNERISKHDELSSKDEYLTASFFRNTYEWEIQFIHDLKDTHRFSAFISIFSFFEGKLKSLVQALENEINPSVKLKDLKGNSDLNVYFKFLTRVVQVNRDCWEQYFTPIQNLKILRNKLVHEGGLITENEIELIKSTRGLSLKPCQQLFSIDDDQIFLNDLLINIDLFFKELIVEVNKHIIHIKPIHV